MKLLSASSNIYIAKALDAQLHLTYRDEGIREFKLGNNRERFDGLPGRTVHGREHPRRAPKFAPATGAPGRSDKPASRDAYPC